MGKCRHADVQYPSFIVHQISMDTRAIFYVRTINDKFIRSVLYLYMYTYRWDMSSPSRYWLNSVLFQAGDWVAIIHLDGSNILPIQLYNEVTVPSSDVVHVQMCAYMYVSAGEVSHHRGL